MKQSATDIMPKLHREIRQLQVDFDHLPEADQALPAPLITESSPSGVMVGRNYNRIWEQPHGPAVSSYYPEPFRAHLYSAGGVTRLHMNAGKIIGAFDEYDVPAEDFSLAYPEDYGWLAIRIMCDYMTGLLNGGASTVDATTTVEPEPEQDDDKTYLFIGDWTRNGNGNYQWFQRWEGDFYQPILDVCYTVGHNVYEPRYYATLIWRYGATDCNTLPPP